VVLTVLVSAGFSALAVAVPAPPAASFTYAPTAPLTQESVTFTSTSDDNGPLAL
jgi:PKD repeat protein